MLVLDACNMSGIPDAGEIVTMIAVRELPPREGCSSRVSLLSPEWDMALQVKSFFKAGDNDAVLTPVGKRGQKESLVVFECL